MTRGRETGPSHIMQIKYNGTPGEQLDAINMYGTDFPKGKFVDVKDAFAARKLSNHPHFTAKGDDVLDVNPKAAALAEKAVSLLEQAAAIEEKDADKAQADTIAKLSEEEKYGRDDGTAGDANPAEAGRTGGKRGPKRG